jgi:hypothetical protein
LRKYSKFSVIGILSLIASAIGLAWGAFEKHRAASLSEGFAPGMGPNYGYSMGPPLLIFGGIAIAFVSFGIKAIQRNNIDSAK